MFPYVSSPEFATYSWKDFFFLVIKNFLNDVYLDDAAFYQCNHLKKCTGKVKYIGEYCFGFSGLEEAVFENTLVIQKRAFNYCNELKTIDLPSTLTEIGKDAFQLGEEKENENVIFIISKQLKEKMPDFFKDRKIEDRNGLEKLLESGKSFKDINNILKSEER